jgi:hypothetical protein
MNTTPNQGRFREYHLLADRLIDIAAKETLAEVARILAIHVAYYQSKHGKVPMEETLRFLHADTLTDEELGVAADAMEYLAAVVGVATGLVDDNPVS